MCIRDRNCYGIITDYTCIPFTEETDMDAFFIPHADLLEEFTAKGIRTDRLVPTGIPVSARFCGKTPKDQARLQPVSYTHLDVYKRQALLCIEWIRP